MYVIRSSSPKVYLTILNSHQNKDHQTSNIFSDAVNISEGGNVGQYGCLFNK